MGGSDNYKTHFVILHSNPEQPRAQDWLDFLTSKNKNDKETWYHKSLSKEFPLLKEYLKIFLPLPLFPFILVLLSLVSP